MHQSSKELAQADFFKDPKTIAQLDPTPLEHAINRAIAQQKEKDKTNGK